MTKTYRPHTHKTRSTSPIARVLISLWCGLLGTSILFLEDIKISYTNAILNWEIDTEYKATLEQILDQYLFTDFLQRPSNWKNGIHRSAQYLYAQEYRFGSTKEDIAKYKRLHDNDTTIYPRDDFGYCYEDNDAFWDLDTTDTDIVTHPEHILLLGGSSMYSSFGGLLGQKISSRNTEVQRFAKIGTGLARLDVFNWLEKIDTMTTEQKIDLVIVQFIGNDCQSLVDEQLQIIAKYGTPEWEKFYLERWKQLLDNLRTKNIDFIIVGTPNVLSPKYAKQLHKVNLLVQKFAQEEDVPFISLWEMSSNRDGSALENIIVQRRKKRLHQEDGIHLEYVGAEMVSAYVMEQLDNKYNWDQCTEHSQ